MTSVCQVIAVLLLLDVLKMSAVLMLLLV